MMGSTRSNALIQIMQIEDEIKRVSNSKRYMKIQQYIRILQDSSGKAIINVENPNDMGKIVQLRKNSVKAKEYLKAYEDLLFEYDMLLSELRNRKKVFTNELFG